MKAVLDVKKLAAYIKNKYESEKHNSISAIKLQKSLYFLFAYWGGFVRKSCQYPASVEESYSQFDEYLYSARIEAWVYGPVIPEVYHEENIDYFFDDKLFDGLEKVKDFIDGLLKDIFEVSDFTLVDISHQDLSWKNNFSHSSQFHNNEIPKEEILDEYVSK